MNFRIKILIVSSIFFLPCLSIGQKIDTTYFFDKKIQSIKKWDGVDFSFIEYSYSGNIKLQTKLSKSGYILDDTKIYDEEGKIMEEFNFVKRSISYFTKGDLNYQFSFPQNDTIVIKTEYYTNGKPYQKIQYINKEPRIFILKKIGPSYNISIPTFNSSGIRIQEVNYYPTGIQLSQFNYNNGNPCNYDQTFWNPDGTIDTSTHMRTTIDKNKLGWPYVNTYYGTIRSFHKSGFEQKIEHYRNGFFDGEQIYWYNNGVLENKNYYVKNSLEGKFESYYSNGNISEIKYFHLGKRCGPSISYYPNQKIKSIISGSVIQEFDTSGNLLPLYANIAKNSRTNNNKEDYPTSGLITGQYAGLDIKTREYYTATFKDGYLDGLIIYYNNSGSKIYEMNFKNGWEDGIYVKYYSKKDAIGNQQIARIGKYKEGLMDSIWTDYDSSGKMTQKALYLNGELSKFLNDDVKIDSSNGRIKYKIITKYGFRNKDKYEYDESGNLKKSTIVFDDTKNLFLSTDYVSNKKTRETTISKEGIPNGLSRLYNSDGRLIETRNYYQGLPDSIWTYFDTNGNTIKTRKFIKGTEQIENSDSLYCFCNEFKSEKYWGYTHYVDSDFELGIINKKLKRFKLDSSYSYFTGSLHHVESWVIETKESPIIYVDGQNGLMINFTPCRHGMNTASIKIENPFFDLFDNLEEDDDEFKPTPFKWFNFLTELSALDEDYSTLMKKAEELTGNKNTSNEFFEKEYGGMVTYKKGISSQLDKYYSNKDYDVYDIFEKFLKKYFRYYIVPQLKKQSMTEVYDKFFFTDDKLKRDYISFSYIQKSLKDIAQLLIETHNVSITIPPTLLRQWDVTKNTPIIKSQNKYYGAEVLIPTEEVEYRDAIDQQIRFVRDGEVCFSPSEISGTGIVITANNVYTDFYSESTPDTSEFKYEPGSFPAHEKYKYNSKTGLKEITQDNYLKSFMGVSIPECQLSILYKNNILQVKGKKFLIDGKEINGVMELGSNTFNDNKELIEFKNYLKLKGLEIITTNEKEKISNGEYLIYFTFKPKK